MSTKAKIHHRQRAHDPTPRIQRSGSSGGQPLERPPPAPREPSFSHSFAAIPVQADAQSHTAGEPPSTLTATHEQIPAPGEGQPSLGLGDAQRSLPPERSLAVQREGDFQLQPPSLLQPPNPAGRYSLGGGMGLTLDPEIEAMAHASLIQQLDPALLGEALAQIPLSLPPGAGAVGPPPPAGGLGAPPPPAAGTGVPPPAVGDAAAATNSWLGQDPAPRPGSISDIIAGITAVPQAKSMFTLLGMQAQAPLRNAFKNEPAAVISAGAVIALGLLGVGVASPEMRQLLLNQLNGKVLPVPKVPGLHFEINTSADSLMIAAHFDVGRWLPTAWGFGPSAPHPIGGPPQPEPFLPGQRLSDPDESTEMGGADLALRIRSALGAGGPMEPAARQQIEQGLGADLTGVRVHTDSEADSLSRAVSARAFTTGQDIFFRSDTYRPASPDGLRLLAHESAHTVQQAAGPVSGVPISGGVAVSTPGDSFEQQAELSAARVADGKPAASLAAPLLVARQQQPSADTPGANQDAQSWRAMGALIGDPPVRSETDPPNKQIVEDQHVYEERRAIASALLETQRARAAAMVDARNNITDYRYWFAKVYSFVTENELAHAASKAFYYPSYVMASVSYFEQLYADNFNAFTEQGPVEAHWRVAFEEASRQKELTDQMYQQLMDNRDREAAGGLAVSATVQSVMGAVRSLVTAMQAHIRFDLPRAEAWVFNSYYSQMPNAKLADFRADFLSMAGVFDNAANQMNQDMADKLSIPVDLIPKLMQDTSMRHLFSADMVSERADTWHRAEELVSSGQAGRDPYSPGNNNQSGGNVTTGDNLAGINNLPTKDLRPSMADPAPEIDDDATVSRIADMSPAQIAALPLVQRLHMLRGLLTGATIGKDEATVLKILQASTQDVATLIDGADAWDMMYALDGDNATELRKFFQDHYYTKTTQNMALRLIQKCLDGETAEWEEEMVVDLLGYQSNGSALVTQIGQLYADGPAAVSDPKRDFKNGLNKLEWQLDGAEQTRLEQLFGKSGF